MGLETTQRSEIYFCYFTQSYEGAYGQLDAAGAFSAQQRLSMRCGGIVWKRKRLTIFGLCLFVA